MKRFIVAVLLVALCIPVVAETIHFPKPAVTATWVPLQFATWQEALNRLAETNGKGTLVHTGHNDYPYVVVELWKCGSCYTPYEQLYAVEATTEGCVPSNSRFRAATSFDGTPLMIWRK